MDDPLFKLGCRNLQEQVREVNGLLLLLLAGLCRRIHCTQGNTTTMVRW